MTHKTVDDIERERAERERKAFVENIGKDISEVFDGTIRNPIRKNKKWIMFKWLGGLFLFLFLITIILGIIWLLKALIKSLFFGG